MRPVRGPTYFYPRSPRGERPDAATMLIDAAQFLSTLPARGATKSMKMSADDLKISIHAPREGSD